MRKMTEQEAREFIRHNKFGLLSLAEGGKAYGVPLFYGYDGRDLYFQTREGLKTRFAGATREACFTIVRVMSLDDWASVHVFGELETMGNGPDKLRAMHALMSVPLPPAFGESALGEPRRTDERVVVYRLPVARLSGRYSQTPGALEPEVATRGM